MKDIKQLSISTVTTAIVNGGIHPEEMPLLDDDTITLFSESIKPGYFTDLLKANAHLAEENRLDLLLIVSD